MRYTVILLVAASVAPACVYAAECPVFSYLPQPDQPASGLVKIRPDAQRVLLAQVPESVPSKVCWYASTDGTLSAMAPKAARVFLFRQVNGEWLFEQARDVVEVVG